LDRSFSPTGYKSLQLFQIHLVFPWDLEALLVHFDLEVLADLSEWKNGNKEYFRFANARHFQYLIVFVRRHVEAIRNEWKDN
jgi:hypothetical protein